MSFACRNKTTHVICQCIIYAMVKVGDAHPTCLSGEIEK